MNTTVRAVFRPEAELTLFLRMRTEISPKYSENVFQQKSYSPVTTCRKWGRRTAAEFSETNSDRFDNVFCNYA